MNLNTLQTVEIFLLMFLMLILITSQTVFSQTLHSSLHSYTASQQIDGAESGKVSFFFFFYVCMSHTIDYAWTQNGSWGKLSTMLSFTLTKVPSLISLCPSSFLLLMIFPIKSNHIKITQSKNNCVQTTCLEFNHY